MTTSVTPGPPAEQPDTELATASPLSASPFVGSELVQSTAEARIELGAVGRIPVLAVGPVVDGGRFSAKAVIGEPVPVTATVFREGHDAVAATAVLLSPDGIEHTRARMVALAPGTDRYAATLVPDAEGRWAFRVEGWSDVYGTWEHAAGIKVPAGIDVELMLEEGAQMVERALHVPGLESADVAVLEDVVATLRNTDRDPQDRLAVATPPPLHDRVAPAPPSDPGTP